MYYDICKALSIGITILAVLAIVLRRSVPTSKENRPVLSPSKLPPPEPSSLSVEQARTLVDEIIAEGGKLFVNPVDNVSASIEQLGPITQEFFVKYGSLCIGGLELSASEICASEYTYGYLSIGHSEDWDVIQWPGDDEVFVVEGGGASVADMGVRFSSVYHLVLDEVQLEFSAQHHAG